MLKTKRSISLVAIGLLAVLTLSSPLGAETKPVGNIQAPAKTPFELGVEAYDAGRYKEAYDIWLPLAAKRDLAAMRNLGHLLRQGLGVPQDLPRALKYYEEAAEAGLPGAMANLAQMYQAGQGTRPNPEEAARWYYAAMRSGHILSAYYLAGMLEKGEGIRADPEKAIILYRLAANAGHTPSIARLAILAPETAAPTETASLPAATRPPGSMAPIPNPPEVPLPRERGQPAEIASTVAPGAPGAPTVSTAPQIPALRGPLLAGFDRIEVPGSGELPGNGAIEPFAGFEDLFESAEAPPLCWAPTKAFDAFILMCRMRAGQN